jgi:hypothetical protein
MVRPIKLVSLCAVVAVIAMSTSYANTITASPGMAVMGETSTVTFTAQVGQTQQELDDGWTLSWTVNGQPVQGDNDAQVDWAPTAGGSIAVHVDLFDNQNPPVVQASTDISYSVIDIQVVVAPEEVSQQDDQGRYYAFFVSFRQACMNRTGVIGYALRRFQTAEDTHGTNGSSGDAS